MSKKIIFIDVDGTLTSDQDEICASAKLACQKARENGHIVCVCTGRSKPEIYKNILEIGFDGIIGAGGGYAQLGDKYLFRKIIAPESVRHLVDYFTRRKVDFFLESNEGLFGSKNLRSKLEFCVTAGLKEADKEKALAHPIFEAISFNEKNLYRDDINKVCFLETLGVSFAEIRQEFCEEFEFLQCTIPILGKQSGELVVPGVNKAVAIKTVIEHLGILQKHTVAIGDGNNDIEMIEFCQVGIAMGNATQNLKNVANYVTDSIAQDGLYNAFKKYGLI